MFARAAFVSILLAGAAIVLISIELSEVLSLSDRVTVMARGRLSRPMPTDDLDQAELGLLMSATAL